MLKICNDNREEIENEFMALLMNKNEVFNITQIKSQYLHFDRNKKIFDYCAESYRDNGIVDIVKVSEKHKDFDLNYFMELLLNTLYYKNCWREQLKINEESIIKYYKEDVIQILNERLKKKQINYDEFMVKIKKLDDIQLIDNTPTLTIKEIEDNINTEISRVNLNNFEKLNNTLQLVRGDFLIIGATTGAGKSGFMLNLLNDLMTGYQCIYFNMEMSKSTIYKRIISINADVPMDYLLKPSEYQKKLIDSSLQKIEQAEMIVEHKANDIKQIRAVIGKLKDKDRHTVLFIDHLGLCKADGTKSLYEQATEVAKQLRQICLEYDCTIISASQLNRGAYSSDELSLSMLKDSGELENSASKVILLYRDKESNKDDKVVDMNIEIAKNRDGICGVVKMNYDKTKQIFKEK